MAKKRPIDCHKCRHYYVTWQESTPHGCKAMRFKSAQLPSVVVYRNSGAECLYYELRAVDGHEQERRLSHSHKSK